MNNKCVKGKVLSPKQLATNLLGARKTRGAARQLEAEIEYAYLRRQGWENTLAPHSNFYGWQKLIDGTLVHVSMDVAMNIQQALTPEDWK